MTRKWDLKAEAVKSPNHTLITLIHNAISFHVVSVCVLQVLSVHLNGWKLDRKLGLGLMLLYSIFLLCSILFGQLQRRHTLQCVLVLISLLQFFYCRSGTKSWLISCLRTEQQQEEIQCSTETTSEWYSRSGQSFVLSTAETDKVFE